MKKIRKVRDYYTINPDLYNDFVIYIENNNLDKSKLLESFIREYMNKLNNL